MIVCVCVCVLYAAVEMQLSQCTTPIRTDAMDMDNGIYYLTVCRKETQLSILTFPVNPGTKKNFLVAVFRMHVLVHVCTLPSRSPALL